MVKGYHGDIVTGPFVAYGLDFSQTALAVDKTRLERTAGVRSVDRLTEMLKRIEEKASGAADMVTITFLPLVCEKELSKGDIYAETYDVGFVGCSVTHQVSTWHKSIPITGVIVGHLARIPCFDNVLRCPGYSRGPS